MRLRYLRLRAPFLRFVSGVRTPCRSLHITAATVAVSCDRYAYVRTLRCVAARD